MAPFSALHAAFRYLAAISAWLETFFWSGVERPKTIHGASNSELASAILLFVHVCCPLGFNILRPGIHKPAGLGVRCHEFWCLWISIYPLSFGRIQFVYRRCDAPFWVRDCGWNRSALRFVLPFLASDAQILKTLPCFCCPEFAWKLCFSRDLLASERFGSPEVCENFCHERSIDRVHWLVSSTAVADF